MKKINYLSYQEAEELKKAVHEKLKEIKELKNGIHVKIAAVISVPFYDEEEEDEEFGRSSFGSLDALQNVNSGRQHWAFASRFLDEQFRKQSNPISKIFDI